jgi:F-type H+-transporting ATPase subunit b
MAETTHATTEHPAGGSEKHGAFPPFERENFASQIIWLALAFGLLYYLMSKLALPRVESILEARRGRIASDLDTAQRMRTESEAAAAAYEASLAKAREEAHEIATETRETVGHETEATRKELEAELAVKLAAAEDQIAATKAAALGNVRAIAVEAAAAILERLLGRAPDKTALNEAVDAAIRG